MLDRLIGREVRRSISKLPSSYFRMYRERGK